MSGEDSSSGGPSQPPKSFSISLGGSKSNSKSKAPSFTPKPLKALNGTKRPQASLHDSDDDDEQTHAEPQLVSAFDHAAGGAISLEGQTQKKQPLIIQGSKNRDWREESRRKRGRNLLPQEVQASQANGPVAEDKKDAVNGGPQAFGLNLMNNDKDDGAMRDGETQGTQSRVEEGEPAKHKNDDELALEALMSDGTARKSNMILAPASAPDDVSNGINGNAGPGISEDDAFKADVSSRPDSASLDQYAAVPVEEFGAALLRGMGWKEGDVVGKRKDQIGKPRLVERRPALLGIGAKEAPGVVGDELGSWGKATKGKRQVDKTYNPVLLKNAKTGEMLTEDELKGRIQESKKEEDWRQRRDRNLRDDRDKKGGDERSRDRDREQEGDRSRRDRDRDRDRDQDHDRDRDRDRDYNSSRHSSSSRRERSRSSDGRHRRRREDEEDYYARRNRDKERSRRDREDDRPNSRSSNRSHRDREQYDKSSGRRREEIY